MTIKTSISSQVGKNSRPYFQCVNHRPVPGKRHQQHLHSFKLNFWYWQLAYIPGTGRFSIFFLIFFSFVPGRGVGKWNKEGRKQVSHQSDLFPIPIGKHFSDVRFPTENWGSWISLNIWWDTVSKWTHWLQKEADNLERGLCCACWDYYPWLSGGESDLIKEVPPIQRLPWRLNWKKRFAKYATPAANPVRTTPFTVKTKR